MTNRTITKPADHGGAHLTDLSLKTTDEWATEVIRTKGSKPGKPLFRYGCAKSGLVFSEIAPLLNGP